MSETSNPVPHCLVCKQKSDAVPLLTLTYRDQAVWICPQHLPVLIHHPAQLIGILPGAENLKEAEHHDH